MKRHLYLTIVSTMAALALTLTGCIGLQKPKPANPSIKKHKAGNAKDASPEAIRQIVVFPFIDASRTHAADETVQCPFCLNTFTVEKVAAGAARKLSLLALNALKKKEIYTVFVAPAVPSKGKRSHLRNRVLEAARQAGADAVLVGKVYRYTERVGNEFAVSRPASVMVDLDLLRTFDGHTIWDQHIDETQEAFFENLSKLGAFFRRKGRWVTVDALAASAMTEAFLYFPQR